MKLQDFVDKVNNVNYFNINKFNSTFENKIKNYPTNSISIRESVFKSKELSKEEAEQFCSALDKEVTKFILDFSNKYTI